MRQAGRAFARALRGRLSRRSRWIASLALTGATLLLTLGAAQAQTATTTTLTSSPNSSTLSQPVTFTATVAGSGGTPTGSVTFTDTTTSQTLGTITLGNVGGAQQAAFTTSALTAGTHHIQASYNGDANFAASSAAIDQIVLKVAPEPQLSQSSVTTAFSEPVTFTATFFQPGGAFTPTGTITFSDNGQTLASLTAMVAGTLISTAAAAVH
jgi:Bacterial Ig-like domain (group 3)